MTLGEKFLREAKQGKLDLKPDDAYVTFLINEDMKHRADSSRIYATGPNLYAWDMMTWLGVDCA